LELDVVIDIDVEKDVAVSIVEIYPGADARTVAR